MFTIIDYLAWTGVGIMAISLSSYEYAYEHAYSVQNDISYYEQLSKIEQTINKMLYGRNHNLQMYTEHPLAIMFSIISGFISFAILFTVCMIVIF